MSIYKSYQHLLTEAKELTPAQKAENLRKAKELRAKYLADNGLDENGNQLKKARPLTDDEVMEKSRKEWEEKTAKTSIEGDSPYDQPRVDMEIAKLMAACYEHALINHGENKAAMDTADSFMTYMGFFKVDIGTELQYNPLKHEAIVGIPLKAKCVVVQPGWMYDTRPILRPKVKPL